MKQVSFVVPCYNSENYLRRCLDSFLVDEVLADIEVIVINDGSTDHTSEIAHGYQNQYPDVFRIIDKENGGHGSGINTGIDIACGRYFKVIDSDDWVVKENLPAYVCALRQHTADVIVNGYQSINAKTGAIISFPVPDPLGGTILTFPELMNHYDDLRDCCTFHGITYSTKLLQKSRYRLTEGVFYEDQEYATIYFYFATHFLILPFYLYQYQVGDENQSIAIPNQVKRIGHIRTVAENIIQYWNNREPMDPYVNEYFIQKMSVFITSYFATALVKKPEKKAGRLLAKDFYRYLQKNKPILLKRTSRKRAMLVILNYFSFSPLVYQKLLNSSVYKSFRRFWLQ